MRFHPKYVQIIGDAVIPVLGFLWWNWNVYFIILFYFLDILVKEVVLHFKSKKINSFGKENHQTDQTIDWIKLGGISLVLIGITVFIVQKIMPFILPAFNAIDELSKFWNYKDMGIEQGYILVPLVILMGYLQYKNEFILPKIYEKITISHLWKKHLKAYIVLLAFTAFTFGLVQFISISEGILVIGIITLSSAYQWYELKRSN